MVDQSSPVTTSEKQAVPVAQEAMTQPGFVVWHSSEEDGGPDAGITVGLGDGKMLWIGERSGREGDGMGLLVYGDQAIDANASLGEYDEIRDLIEQHVAPALSRALSTPSEQFAKSSPDAETGCHGARHLLLNLLATVHRDGGQYVDAYGEFKATQDAVQIVASLLSAASAINFTRKVADLAGDELDAHASSELRDLARETLAISSPDAAGSGGEALHIRARKADEVAKRTAGDDLPDATQTREAEGKTAEHARIVSKAKEALRLTQGCMECNAEDERRWMDTIRWLEEQA